MPSFPKPKFDYTVSLSREIRALHKYRDHTEGVKIPAATTKNLRIATWNIANLGAQDRQDSHLKIIADIISWFDIVAVLEVKDNYAQFKAIVERLGSHFQFIF